jgi:hypothetical protein
MGISSSGTGHHWSPAYSLTVLDEVSIKQRVPKNDFLMLARLISLPFS